MSQAETQETAANPCSNPNIISLVEQFYYREARLLDERKYLQWLKLLCEDIRYSIPSRYIATPDPALRGTEALHAIEHELERGGPDCAPLREENFFNLAIRADRALKMNAWADNPPARTRRFISNVEVFSCEEGYQSFSNFMMTYSRHSTVEHSYTGQRRDTLRQVDGELKIARREVIFDWNVINVPTLGLFF
ncbi:aromatic-ring-hydroxylating dioxygenase subunit beta [Parahaliea sp. F7430]|uniref:Aromatic-ring-hydroxylating dioxygenase subunit beta n=1 Tax=Sediminihaliea albiluteola TaxID=2758564 RepID=A0A7W2TTZ1_9GAMM|nr:aromatic-ring-hydroxylating dioxygenase subunit beta [Sediminihaliea albiluteola]MBA6411820.1 aromatic-ring-hydroxylating dioxygenase subunit beta [Sediminihaliea albiluteola]